MYLLIRKRPGCHAQRRTLRRYIELLRDMARSVSIARLCIGIFSPTRTLYCRMRSVSPRKRLELLGACCRISAPSVYRSWAIRFFASKCRINFAELCSNTSPQLANTRRFRRCIYSQIISNLMRELTEFASVADAYVTSRSSVRDPCRTIERYVAKGREANRCAPWA